MFIFPIMTFVFLTLAIYRRYASRLSLPKAFMLAAVVWIGLFLTIRGVLNDFQILKIPYFFVCWIFMTWLAILFCTFFSADKMANADTLNLKRKISVFFANAKAVDIIMFVLMVVILLLIALISYQGSIKIL